MTKIRGHLGWHGQARGAGIDLHAQETADDIADSNEPRFAAVRALERFMSELEGVGCLGTACTHRDHTISHVSIQ